MQKIVLTAIIALNFASLARAQGEDIRVQNVTVTVTDRAGRIFDEGTLESTLIAAPGYENGQTLGTETVQFNVGDLAKTFPIRDGRADMRLLVQGDTSKEPFKYQLAGKLTDGRRFVSKNIDVTPNTRSLTLVAPEIMAPHTRAEAVQGIGFFVIAAGLVVLTFFYWGFRRMLFNKKMEVESAKPLSTIYTLIGLLVLVLVVGFAWFRPDFWTSLNSIYLTVGGGFIVVYSVFAFLLFFLTRNQPVRS
jgi:hypothetical protein